MARKSLKTKKFRKVVKWNNPFGDDFRKSKKFTGYPMLAIFMIIPVLNIILGLSTLYFCFKRRTIYWEEIKE